MDVGSTTVKAVVVEDDRVLWRDYQRHGTKQAEKVLEFLNRMQDDCGLSAARDRIFLTGSGPPPGRGNLLDTVVILPWRKFSRDFRADNFRLLPQALVPLASQ